ncbi:MULTISPECIES: BMP family ABC transporter substrate-binding protein [unclassified Fusibacter]|uniref:BMP family ABC transporter substrate-binding protein n=1 Tax=unclassified Fusibacter TaxID=2624464 RepID=UPI0010105C78|nr:MULTISPECIES: BMP family ABC transporter substrate-binding protein [unclassified Fusibacter]MCK8059953.1 BMP family ABC transporter substrate-binding protein [Fusibacter sp. A2]NPE22095.1 BMP family ABC transporter substrate-binding protein [Fusibacter sp. A1]RXV60874.1 BMP family ABC transporter substrate-binding protein [Fusibacter sp. A1]
MKRVIAVVLIMLLSFSLIACGSTEETKSEDQTLTVGFVYVGPVGDGGWTYAHNEGRLVLENELGVKTLYKETVAEDAEVKTVVTGMIDQGASVIFATSFGYMEYIDQLAKEFPDVTFLHCSGYTSAENFNNYFGRMYEPRFLSGIVAGLKTETNKLGYVAAFEIPEVIRGINAFTLGAQSVNPDVEVEVVWTHTWYDPATEKEAAKALIDGGADVIAQHQDTAGPQQAAEEAGVFAIGYNTDSRDKAPSAYMTAPVWNWGPYYVDQVQKVIDGTWTSVNYWGGMADGVVAIDTLTENAPAEAKKVVEESAQKIISGELHPFAGPVYDQNGELKVAEGEVLSDGDMLGMMWFVEGVIGKIE